MVVLSFDQPSYSISEASAGVEVCVNLFGAVEKTIVANLFTSNKSALGTHIMSCHVKLIEFRLCFFSIDTAGVDYTPVMVEIEFNSSVAMQCQVIPVVSDTILEIDETFLINLEVSDPDVLLENNTATIAIANDDRKLFRISYRFVACW